MCNAHRQHRFHRPASGRSLGHERRTVALAELVAIVALALSTIVAATVVSVGIARADVAGNVIDNEGSLFAVALLLGSDFHRHGRSDRLHAAGPPAEKALVASPSIETGPGRIAASRAGKRRFYADAFFLPLAYRPPKGGGKVRCRYEPKVEIS